jgi:phosphatidylserine synthase
MAGSGAQPDIDVIPSGLMRWEYLLLVYLVFASFLVWYVAENMLVWEPEESFWGLPKPVAGALMIAITWIVMNFVLFAVYYYVITKRAKSIGSKEG